MKEVKLSDGRVVVIKKGTGRDYIEARKIATQTGEDIFVVLLHRLAETKEGKAIPIEELKNLPLGDYMTLETALFEVNPLPEGLKGQSSFSSVKASDTVN